jgi:hypothetical protein
MAIVQRVQWTCPICKRRYAIPATAPTPSRCPQCRQDEVELPANAVVSDAVDRDAETEDVSADEMAENTGIAALAAIQLEVAEEAARGPTKAAPIIRYTDRSQKTLRTLILVFAVLTGLAVVAAVFGLLNGLRVAYAMEATPARTEMIFKAIGALCGGIIAAIVFFTIREVIRILLDIEENTRPR